MSCGRGGRGHLAGAWCNPAQQGGKQLAWGLGFGLALAALPLMVISNMLATPAITLYALSTVFALVISAVVLFATYLPTRQALQLEPNTALRYE